MLWPLNDNQKELRMYVCQDIIACSRTEPDFLCRATTGNETQTFKYDKEANPLISQWKLLMSPWSMKSKFQVMLITFFVLSQLLLQSQWSITNPACRFYVVCFAQLMRRDENGARTNRGSFTTLHPLIMSLASSSSWPRGTSPYKNKTPIHLIFLHIIFLFFKHKLTIRESSFEGVEVLTSEPWRQS